MKNKEIFTKIANKVSRSEKVLRKPRAVHPGRDWLIGLTFATLIFAVIVFWSVRTYSEYANVSIGDQNSQSDKVVVYREEMVKTAIEKINERSEVHKSLLGEYTSTVEEVDVKSEEVSTTTEDSNVDEEEGVVGEAEAETGIEAVIEVEETAEEELVSEGDVGEEAPVE